MNDLEALAVRCEQADASEQREMLMDAWAALFPKSERNRRERVEHWRRFARMLEAEAYESAALTLVPEGWWLTNFYFCHPEFRAPSDREWHAELAGEVSWVEQEYGPELEYECQGGNAATPALALCAASSRARHQ